MTSLIGVGLVVPVPMLVVLDLALGLLEGQVVALKVQAVALEGLVVWLAQQGMGMLQAVAVQVVLYWL